MIIYHLSVLLGQKILISENFFKFPFYFGAWKTCKVFKMGTW